ncbi:ribokinase-like isoform X3 [Rhodamnia argentea]|uniref:Ribokinase-like isoform X3 n=1 Tax=Rhodamnia argentea TaxID=178133 RepID=A0A8B8QQJ9_9MYRT|nr:ribokinase-like isoform X3 [Rhodamnia argentea]
MSSWSLPPSPLECLVVGFGGICLDYLAVLSTFPKPDDKTRCRSMKVQGGGDVANALTCLARLGVTARLISKIADDVHGKSLLEELRADGVDASFLVVAKDGRTPFSYVIVDQSTRTRTCIFTPGFPLMEPADVCPGLTSAVKGARFVYFDARYTDTAVVVAREAARQNIPILLDAEKRRPGLDDLLDLSDYVVCSAKFPKAWTEAPSMPSALISMLLRLPKLKFAIVTLGEHGCLMLERSSEAENPLMGEEDADSLLHSLEQEKDDSVAPPMCISSRVAKLKANGIGTLTGRLFVCTAEKIPPSELVDTTGAGDAFIGAILYALCMNMPPEKMLPFAATVAAAGCKELGARTGLPYRNDPCLAPFLGQTGKSAKSNGECLPCNGHVMLHTNMVSASGCASGV